MSIYYADIQAVKHATFEVFPTQYNVAKQVGYTTSLSQYFDQVIMFFVVHVQFCIFNTVNNLTCHTIHVIFILDFFKDICIFYDDNA